jgi:nucleoside-diphosphate-sugar epimerase
MTRTLVTGGSGFIGRYVCERLIADGCEVTILDLVPPAWPSDGIRVVVGDVRDPSAVDDAMVGCDEVFHLAAAHHDFGISEATYFDVNEGSAKVLCAAMDRAGIRSACFFSSVAVYGAVPEPRTEESAVAPDSPYGASKLAGEQVFRSWTGQGGDRRVLVIRPAVVFGPRNFANMYALIRQIHSRLFLPIGSGGNVKSTAFVQNLVDATFHLWHCPNRPAFDVYNYADTPHLTSREICDAISEALGRSPLRRSLPLPVALALASPFDAVSRLTGRNLPISSMRVRKLASLQTRFEADKVRQSGFAPAVPLREGLHRMTRWFLDEGRHQPVISHIPPAHVGGSLVATRKSAGA